mmetsp:Transcript_80026/g.226882  ORF Transcript_80026/g.226882 Transcript_80026/m.226882 type:complete len:204 (+) Transcript_80026:416-1027(+)
MSVSRTMLHLSTQKPRHSPYSGSWYFGSTSKPSRARWADNSDPTSWRDSAAVTSKRARNATSSVGISVEHCMCPASAACTTAGWTKREATAARAAARMTLSGRQICRRADSATSRARAALITPHTSLPPTKLSMRCFTSSARTMPSHGPAAPMPLSPPLRLRETQSSHARSCARHMACTEASSAWREASQSHARNSCREASPR